MNKVKINKFINKHVTSDNVQMAVLFVPLLIILIQKINAGDFSWDGFFDISILISFLFAFLCGNIAKAITQYVSAKFEDSTKLTENYEWLVKKYSNENMVSYQNKQFPVIPLVLRKAQDQAFDIVFNHDMCEKKYELPKQVSENSDWLMQAHKHSTVYNNMNVRINNIKHHDNQLLITYSKTTYYDSLITNRAMDYELSNGKTIREIYEPGPFMNYLSDSKMSNHLGFNGFIETKDGKIVLVVRGDNLSIGKNTLADSIGAAYKTKHGLDENRRMSVETLRKAIRMEIQDELKIKIREDVKLEQTIFAFYRDMVEGGKPQFLFYYKLPDLTVEQFKKNFEKEKKSTDKKNVIIDGERFVFLGLEEMKECQIHPEKIVLPNGKEYKMMPSASAAIVMLLEHCDKKNQS